MRTSLCFSLLLAACLPVRPLGGLLACNNDGACPEDYICAADHRCYPADAVGEPTCSATQINCDGDALGVCEANILADGENCGACGHLCSAPNSIPSCRDGGCVLGACLSGFADCDGRAENGCEANIGFDPRNCGGCGQACSTTSGAPTCHNGVCGLSDCAVGLGDCNFDGGDGCESALGTRDNCLFCGDRCDFKNGVASCQGTTCKLSGCSAPFGNCDAVEENGCETNLTNSPEHCGACGQACAPQNGVASCQSGVCAVAGCNAGFGDCNQQNGDGCEIDLRSDINHCGSCGKVCSGQNGAPTCQNGACGIVCSASFANCNTDVSDGCEIDTRSSVDHCGACQNKCGTLHGAPSCDVGACAIACDQNWGDCDGNNATGCETDVLGNINHCGGCGQACSQNGGTASCTAGACGISCAAGRGNCNTSVADGCEVDLNTNANNCGACGVSCGSGGACMQGRCVTALANVTSSLDAMILVGSKIYYADAGEIRSLPVGGGQSELIATEDTQVLASDGTYLYWVRSNAGALEARRIALGQAATVESLGSGGTGTPAAAVVSDGYFYFSTTTLHRVATAPGSTVTSFGTCDATPIVGLTATTTHILWACSPKIYKRSKTSGAQTQLHTFTGAADILDDGTYTYLVNGTRIVRWLSTNPATWTYFLTQLQPGNLTSMAQDATQVFWTGYDSLSFRNKGSPTTITSLGGFPGSAHLLVDVNSFYLVTLGAAQPAILRIAR